MKEPETQIFSLFQFRPFPFVILDFNARGAITVNNSKSHYYRRTGRRQPEKGNQLGGSAKRINFRTRQGHYSSGRESPLPPSDHRAFLSLRSGALCTPPPTPSVGKGGRDSVREGHSTVSASAEALYNALAPLLPYVFTFLCCGLPNCNYVYISP